MLNIPFRAVGAGAWDASHYSSGYIKMMRLRLWFWLRNTGVQPVLESLDDFF
jgi:hypothetical protein